MPNLNKVLLMGNVTRDPEVKYTPKGTAIAQIGMAINRTWSDDSGQKKEEVTFVDVEFFGRVAEIAGQYVKKGNPLFVEGRLKLDTWDDKATGQKRSKMKVVCENMQLMGGKPSGEQKPQQRPPVAQSPRPAADPDLDPTPDPSGIPF